MFMQFLEICMGKVLLFCSLHNCFWWKLVYTWLDLQKRKQTELCKKLFKFAFQKSWIVLHVASGGKGMDCAILRLLEKVIFVPFLLNKTKLIISSSLTKLFYGTKTLRKYSLWPQMSSLPWVNLFLFANLFFWVKKISKVCTKLIFSTKGYSI